MNTAVEQIIKQAEQLSLAEQLELIAHLAQRSRVLAEVQMPRRKWSEMAGIIDYPLFGEDVQAYISRTREESDRMREEGLRGMRDENQ
ncbi:MAG: hypothetical protein M1546_20325 [Chloroflexi bacterium]|nr:hypothetical protein [Chloroflexota bacterium]